MACYYYPPLLDQNHRQTLSDGDWKARLYIMHFDSRSATGCQQPDRLCKDSPFRASFQNTCLENGRLDGLAI